MLGMPLLAPRMTTGVVMPGIATAAMPPGAALLPGAPIGLNLTVPVLPAVGLTPALPVVDPFGCGAAATVGAAPMQQAIMQTQDVQETLEPDVLDLQKDFKLDDRITRDLNTQLKKRKQVGEDVGELYEILEGARNPAGMLRIKIREMETGTYRGTATPDKDIEELAKKFKLDAQASAKLSEVLKTREDRKQDLKQLNKHLELSNKPSSLVMLMLKDLRNGKTVQDPEYPAAVGSYRHKMGLNKRHGARRRSRSRSQKKKRRHSSDSSSSPPPAVTRSSGAGPLPSGPGGSLSSGPRPMTLLERFG